MKTFVPIVAGSMLVASMTACHRTDSTGIAPANDGPVARASSADHPGGDGDDHHRHSRKATGESSPYVVGVWKFVPDPKHPDQPKVDTEFRFINPTGLDDLMLEYAFFELDGSFCGCDRDMFPHNHTTVYTILGESLTLSPTNMPVFTCTGTSGAVKSIAFKHNKQKIFVDDALQVGFQTHAFFNVMETPAPNPPNVFPNALTGDRMTEAGLKGITIDEVTIDEINTIHDQCVTVNGKL